MLIASHDDTTYVVTDTLGLCVLWKMDWANWRAGTHMLLELRCPFKEGTTDERIKAFRVGMPC